MTRRGHFFLLALLGILLAATNAGAAMNTVGELRNSFPPTSITGPVLTHDGTYTNYAPVGYAIDPLDSSKFLLYVNKFDHNTDANAKLSVYSGYNSDPTSLTFVGDAITKGGVGTWDARGIYISGRTVLSDNGVVKILYSARASGSDYYRVGLATSTDGRTFTKHAGNPVITPVADYRGSGQGYISGDFYKHNGVYYNYVDAVITWPTTGSRLLYSDDAVTWTDNGTIIVPIGQGNTYDNVIIEGGSAYVFSDNIAVLYGATHTGDSYGWAINLAWMNDPRTPVTKYSGNSIFTQATSVACPVLTDTSRSDVYLFYQLLNYNANEYLTTWDVYVAKLNAPGLRAGVFTSKGAAR